MNDLVKELIATMKEMRAINVEMSAQLTACEAAVHSLALHHPHPERVLSDYLARMDRLADVSSPASIEKKREAFQRFAATMTLALQARD